MSTPLNLTPDATSNPVPTPVPAQSPSDSDVRALATELAKMADPGVQLTLSQGTVVSLDAAGTPPTATITLSGSTTQVAGVRFLTNYTPAVGDTVQILKQSGSLLIFGHVADNGTASSQEGAWIDVTSFGTGFTNNGDSQGDLQYRRIMDHGSWKMQWRGAVALSGTHTSVLGTALDSDYHPTNHKKLILARGMGNGNSILDVQAEFTTSGTIVLQGINYTWGNGNTGTGGSHSHYDGYSDTQLSGYLSQAGSDLGHAHYLGYTDTSAGHTHTMGITVSTPDWISFEDVEYWL